MYGSGGKPEYTVNAGSKKKNTNSSVWLLPQGVLLYAASASDGWKLAEYKLDSLPVRDGMAAANGRLYLATKNGKVLCFDKQ